MSHFGLRIIVKIIIEVFDTKGKKIDICSHMAPLG